ncbi:CoA-transferase family III [Pleurostoma richardsiae]|uniref:CoA-transferase family III n=1 Tax=Pleurostoma richardsiae TaxID=41990 RepID=A0AA38VLJ6_9PEZI|nr:CoA-transferase family III [Pleurostoma richardsiae]
MSTKVYSSIEETKRILSLILDLVPLPQVVRETQKHVSFTASQDYPYFPIPFKESEVASALKAIEGLLACALQDLKEGAHRHRSVTINFEKTTAFLFQAYLARVNGHGKLDNEVKKFLKDTDLLQAQSNPYRQTIESRVKQYTVEELEELNAEKKQAGIPAYTFEEFLRTPHGKANANIPPWTVDNLERITPPRPLRNDSTGRVLSGIKVLELCRIIAGPVMGRILAEYGADVLKITGPNISDVPFFQVDGNMGKHAADLDLKTPEGRQAFETLVLDADVILDGYRPGALERLGYGPLFMSAMAKKRGYGIVYVNENCFGYEGEWASRPGWQQIADCVTGVAWEQGKFMGLDEPVVPPFPISDYGTGCIGAIAALTGLYHRATVGGSWHGKASLMHYDLLLFKAGLYPPEVQRQLRSSTTQEFLDMRHNNSVDQISGAALRGLNHRIFNDRDIIDIWYSCAYGADVAAVKPVAEIEGLKLGFKRASRPNGTDPASWNFRDDEGDYCKSLQCN